MGKLLVELGVKHAIGKRAKPSNDNDAEKRK
jgi:hypothetical protein